MALVVDWYIFQKKIVIIVQQYSLNVVKFNKKWRVDWWRLIIKFHDILITKIKRKRSVYSLLWSDLG